ncbi:MAG: alcohol dehydrogenase catalytic domain-containing protein [Steroidobacteraceae bacterium]
MRAAVFHEIGKPLTIETVPDPIPADGEVIVEVSHAGICGSDLHWSETPGVLQPGTILGHEFCGTIVDANHAQHAVGTRVAVLPIFPCWQCAECRDGHLFHCAAQKGVGYQRPGAFAQAVAVDAKLVRQLPPGLSFQEGALVEPLAVGYRTMSHARALQGANVLVLGAGPIGSAVILFAVLGGAANVIVSEPSSGRRALALSLGATATVDPHSDNVRERFSALCGAPPDIVVECVGIPGMMAQAVDLVRSRGQILSAGGCYLPDTFIPVNALLKEIVINFSLAYEVGDFEAVIDALAREGVKPEPLITDVTTLEQLPASFEALRKPQNQCKVLVAVA